ncbi:MAG TPA: sulfopyruvate decarboxylase subunit alpha [Nitrospirota bacterium]|nr:sulfopyruvate decarboxylase subunit alpha [Nitrospirota bacterium]
MQRPEEELLAMLKTHGVDFTASLPCEKIKTMLEMLAGSFHHVPLTREEEGVGICAGAALSGRRPAVFVQSSGVGNMINALLSLTAFYELPLALFVSRRGVYKEKIEAQVPMGQRLPGILNGAEITFSEINSRDDFSVVDRELPRVFLKNRIHAFLLSPAVWEDSACEAPRAPTAAGQATCGVKDEEAPAILIERREAKGMQTAQCTRFEILQLIAPYLEKKVVVSNLGWPSKELYLIKHQPSNFYMLGSMGMATPIGLGIAQNSKKEVVVIDGDGSLLMNPGALATAAFLAPKNLTIVAIDNGAYGSTGNQPTFASSCVDLEQVAKGFGIRNTDKVADAKDLVGAMRGPRKGPAFIHVLAIPGNKDVPNIPVHHLEIKRLVQGFLATD